MRSLVPQFNKRAVVSFRCDRCDRVFPLTMATHLEGYDLRIPWQIERDFQRHLCTAAVLAQPHHRTRARL